MRVKKATRLGISFAFMQGISPQLSVLNKNFGEISIAQVVTDSRSQIALPMGKLGGDPPKLDSTCLTRRLQIRFDPNDPTFVMQPNSIWRRAQRADQIRLSLCSTYKAQNQRVAILAYFIDPAV